MNQHTGESPEGVDTGPSSTDRPQVLCTHMQHTADYVRHMMGSGMHLSMGEDRSPSLITEVWSFVSTSLSLAPIF